jgi:hypothetical protein
MLMDVTEIFNRADAERRARTYKLAFLGFVEVITAYKITYAAVHALMTTAGREALAKVLREAAHTPTYHMF